MPAADRRRPRADRGRRRLDGRDAGAAGRASATRVCVVLRNDEQAGLAASLNRGLDEASGRYVARLDDDDVRCPERLERQLARMESDAGARGRRSRRHRCSMRRAGPGTHVHPGGATRLRWHALFSSPFFHPTVLVDREHARPARASIRPVVSRERGLRPVDAAASSSRTARTCAEPLVQKRVHPGQASLRRGDVQESFQRADRAARDRASLRPSSGRRAGRARVGPRQRPEIAATRQTLISQCWAAFEGRYGVDAEVRGSPRECSAAGATAGRSSSERSVRAARRCVGETAPADTPARSIGASWLAALDGRLLPARHGRLSGADAVPLAALRPRRRSARSRSHRDLCGARPSRTEPGRSSPSTGRCSCAGVAVPGVARLLRHDYPVTPGIGRALREAQPDVVVVSGWSTFAVAGGDRVVRAHGVPYVLLVESHDLGPRAGWRRAVKGAVVPRIVRKAANVLVVGTAARESVVARGAAARSACAIFANTSTSTRWGERARRAAAATRRAEGGCRLRPRRRRRSLRCAARSGERARHARPRSGGDRRPAASPRRRRQRPRLGAADGARARAWASR